MTTKKLLIKTNKKMENFNSDKNKIALKNALLRMKDFVPDIVVGGLIMGVVMIAFSVPQVHDNSKFAIAFYYAAIILIPILVGLRRRKKLDETARLDSIETLTYSTLMMVSGFLASSILGAIALTRYGFTLMYYIYPWALSIFDIKYGNSTFFPLLIIAIISIIICAPIATYFMKKKK